MKKIKCIFKKFLPKRYFALNRLDRKLESYLDFDGGYFVELGANDGVSQSNSLYFEKYRDWHGVLVEPVPHNYLKCRKNRSTKTNIFCAACVAFDYTREFVRIAYCNLMSTPLGLESDLADSEQHLYLGQQFLKKEEIRFEFGAVARPLNDLLKEAKAPRNIDLLSLDVEGAELEVLKGIDFNEFEFSFMLIECRDFLRIEKYLSSKNYFLKEKLSRHDYLFMKS